MKRRPLSARERAALRGLVFRPLNPMQTLILRARERHQAERTAATFARRMAREEDRALGRHLHPLGDPLTDDARVYNYVKQNGITRPLTRRQQRRRRHKVNAGHVRLAGLVGTR